MRDNNQMETTDMMNVDTFCSRYEKQTSQAAWRYTDDAMTREDFTQYCWLIVMQIYRQIEQNGALKKGTCCSACEAKAEFKVGINADPRCLEHTDWYVRTSITNEAKKRFKQGENSNMAERDRRENRQQTKTIKDEDGNINIDWTIRQKHSTRIGDGEQLSYLIREERYIAIYTQVSPIAKAYLDCCREPGQVAFEAALEDNRQAKARQKAGQLAMNLDKVVIRKKHIAKQLGVSPATISRAIAEIEETRPVLVQ